MEDLLKPATSSIGGNAFLLALAVIQERVRSLPPADREDLYELSKILMTTDSEEERESAQVAMQEIVEKQPACGVTRMQLSTTVPDELKDWVEFISGKIRSARNEANLTQEELAEKTGLPQSHISRLENGKHSPSGTTLEKIAAATGRPMSDFEPSAVR